MRYTVTPAPDGGPPPAGPAHWTRFDDRLLLWDEDPSAVAAAAGAAGERADVRDAGALRLVCQVGGEFQRAHPDVPVLLDKGRYLVVDLAGHEQVGEHVCWSIRPLPADTEVLTRVAPLPGAVPRAAEEAVQALSPASWRAALEHLAALPTRHSASGHYADAAGWAAAELSRLGYRTRLDPVTLPGGGRSANVVAERTGQGAAPRGLVVVSAHLDSVNQAGAAAPAPGADDNASGAAGLLTIAAAVAGIPGAHDLRLILFGGEEQGLHGSRQHVAGLGAAERARVRAVVNMDMIATRNTPTASVLLEGASVSQALMDELAAAAAAHTSLVVQTSLTPFASDHVPFIDAGMPAVLTIEGADRANGNVHTAADTLAHIDDQLAHAILRMNVAAVVGSLGQPAAAGRPGVSGPAVAVRPGCVDVFVIGADAVMYRTRVDG